MNHEIIIREHLWDWMENKDYDRITCSCGMVGLIPAGDEEQHEIHILNEYLLANLKSRI